MADLALGPEHFRFLRWLQEHVKKVLASDEELARPVPTTLEQRLAVAVLQARAKECRAIAGYMDVQGISGHSAVTAGVRNFLLTRSDEIEALGMELVSKWPPLTEEEYAGEQRAKKLKETMTDKKEIVQ